MEKIGFNQTLLFPSVIFFPILFRSFNTNFLAARLFRVQPSSTINPIVMPNAIFFLVTLPVATVWQFRFKLGIHHNGATYERCASCSLIYIMNSSIEFHLFSHIFWLPSLRSYRRLKSIRFLRHQWMQFAELSEILHRSPLIVRH